jgi:hypothetical protein
MNRDSRHEVVFAFPMSGSFFTACNHKGERIFCFLSRILRRTFKKRLPGRSFWKFVRRSLFHLSYCLGWKEEEQKSGKASVPGQVFED